MSTNGQRDQVGTEAADAGSISPCPACSGSHEGLFVYRGHQGRGDYVFCPATSRPVTLNHPPYEPPNYVARRNWNSLTPMQREAIRHILAAEHQGFGFMPVRGQYRRTLSSLRARGIAYNSGGRRDAGWHLTEGGRWTLAGTVRIYGNL